MIRRWNSLCLLLCVLLASDVHAANVTALTGTWSSKSNTVFTGPGFYDPIDELLIEPRLPGISFSFTDDGHYEEAFYLVTSNPTTPSCPTAVLQYQHGKYVLNQNGSISMFPIGVDGRQVLSDPCDSEISTYTRYSQFELYSEWNIVIDEYQGRYRLNLFEWDGTVVRPLYLVYRPPLMLPTVTMNPTSSAATETSTSTSVSSRHKIKRSFENRPRTSARKTATIDYDFWWWSALCLVVGCGSSYVVMQTRQLKVE
ncbi:chaperone for protein-folding within the ER, fungal-domain-containing protein [Kockiozyma suomiensis]|uniref:chaperone for protein-folding within the ER, fungal-domain-containing protein n=1 Tax=Kockiozyma suomiensis TaxID=1337062 RepID=UPI00334313CE